MGWLGGGGANCYKELLSEEYLVHAAVQWVKDTCFARYIIVHFDAIHNTVEVILHYDLCNFAASQNCFRPLVDGVIFLILVCQSLSEK